MMKLQTTATKLGKSVRHFINYAYKFIHYTILYCMCCIYYVLFLFCFLLNQYVPALRKYIFKRH